MRHALTVAALLGVVLCAPGARAAPPTCAVYEQGKEALREGRYDAALRLFEPCLSLQPKDETEAWGYRLAVGLTHDKRGAGGLAVAHYRRFLADTAGKTLSPAWQERREKVKLSVRRLHADLMTSHGKLTVTTVPAEATVEVDGVEAAAAGEPSDGAEVYVKPGHHEVVAKHSGHLPAKREVDVQRGQTEDVTLYLQPSPVVERLDPEQDAAGPPGQAGADVNAAATSDPVQAERGETAGAPGAATWAAFGLTGALLAGGITFTALASSDVDAIGALNIDALGSKEYGAQRRDLEESLNDREIASWALYGLSGGAVTAAVILLALDLTDEDAEAAGVGFPRPYVDPRRDGAVAGLTW